INGKGANVWVHSSQAKADTTTNTAYGLNLNDAVKLQVKKEPFILNGSHGFIAKSRINANNQLTQSSHVRTMPQTASHIDNKIIKTLPKGTKISPIGSVGAWYGTEVGGSRKV